MVEATAVYLTAHPAIGLCQANGCLQSCRAMVPHPPQCSGWEALPHFVPSAAELKHTPGINRPIFFFCCQKRTMEVGSAFPRNTDPQGHSTGVKGNFHGGVVKTFRILGSTICRDLKWASNNNPIGKKHHQNFCSTQSSSSLFSLGQEQTTTHQKVCRENHWLQLAFFPGLVHLLESGNSIKNQCRPFTHWTQPFPSPSLC